MGDEDTRAPADAYTHGHHESVLRSHRWRTADNSAAYLLPHLRPGMRLLDVGCGPGTITRDLARIVAPGEVVGVDSAESVVADARAAATTERAGATASGAGGGPDRVAFRTGNAYALDLEARSFDIVHAHQVLQHLSDPVAALREMRRVCRPGGLVAARDSDYAAMTWYPDVPELDAWLDLYHRVARGNRAEPDAGRRLTAWARAAGFGEVAASASAWCFATADERAWWAGLWADRITASALADQALERGLASADDLDRMATGWRAWAAEEEGWFAVLHGEILARA